MRNKQLLTDKENERMFADMVESMLKGHYPRQPKQHKRIDLRYTSDSRSCVESFGSYHAITLGKMKGIDTFTLLNHEAGHILFNSPTKSAEDMITKWAEAWKTGPTPKMLIKKTYWYVLNVIEDQRIESLMAKLYLYNKKRFYRARVTVARDWGDGNCNILTMLSCIRFFRDDIVRENILYPSQEREYELAKKILSEVEGTGNRGALIGLAKFKQYIDLYIAYFVENGPEHYQIWEDDVDMNSLDYDEVGRVGVSDINVGSQAYTEFQSGILGGKLRFSDRLFEEAREAGERDVEYIKEILSNVDINKMDSHDVIEGDNEEFNGVGEPIQEIVNDMSKMFKKMNEIPRTVIGYEGDEVDIESYIKNKVERYDVAKCLIDTKYIQGASILVSVDGSNSMEDSEHGCSSMTRARDMVATMYKSIDNMNNINLRAIVWAGNLMGQMNVTSIKSLEDTRNIRQTPEYPTTPTHMAIEYSTKMMKRMKGRKKLLIFITDGKPEHVKNGMTLPTQTVVKMSANAMVKGMRRCDNMIVMLIKPSDTSQKCSEDIFGKRLIITDDMKSGSDIIMNRFKSLVMGVLS